MESVLVCCNGQCIKREDLEKTVLSAKKNYNEKVSVDFKNEMEHRERELIKEYYKKYSSSRKLAAALQISQSLANKLIQKYIE